MGALVDVTILQKDLPDQHVSKLSRVYSGKSAYSAFFRSVRDVNLEIRGIPIVQTAEFLCGSPQQTG
jgi:hypothetical protein